MLDINQLLISSDATIRDALDRINQNHLGLIFLQSEDHRVVGVATDGDIRRGLLGGLALDAPINNCANFNFTSAPASTPRELLLKQLDQRIRAIPLLNERDELVSVVSRDSLPLPQESRVYSRARSPVRISFGGGGSDLTHYFSRDKDGAVINATISLFAHATLRVRTDQKIFIYSNDLAKGIEADSLSDLLVLGGSFGLVQSILKTIRPEFGFELFLNSDFPMSSGLGGSASVAASVIGCFNELRVDKWDLHELAEIAYQAERHYLGIEGGWQDQYATVFGGFNFMEFRMEQNIVHPLRLSLDILHELEESLVLCDTGLKHDSGGIHEDQREQMKVDSVLAAVKSNVDLTYQIRNHLLRGRLLDFGRSLNEAWMYKRKFSKKISSEELDKIYDDALHNGAVGGKLLGAGAGGFFLFYVSPFRKFNLLQHLHEKGLKVHPFKFENKGLQTWSVRELGEI